MPFGTSLGPFSSIIAITIQMIPRMIVMPFGTSFGPLIQWLQVGLYKSLCFPLLATWKKHLTSGLLSSILSVSIATFPLKHENGLC